MNQRTTFPRYTQEIDCGNIPEFALLYDGSITGSPTLSLGNILFTGGVSLHKGRGAGKGQSPGVFSIPFNAILPGGKGVKIGSCTTLQNKVVDFKCCDGICGEDEEDLVINLKYLPTCEDPIQDNFFMDYRIVYDTHCNLTCEDKLRLLANEINTRDEGRAPAVATVVQVGDDWTLRLTGKGVNFHVQYFGGLLGGETVIGYSNSRLMASKMQEWFGKEIFNQCTTDECFNYVEIFFYDTFREAGHTAPSFFSADVSKQTLKIRSAIIVFDVDQTTPYNALNTILYAAGNGVDAKISSATPAASLANVYDYVITRTDAGDATALTAVQTAYTTEVLPISRSLYKDGVSYYVITTASSTAPTAQGSDIVTPGVFTNAVLPCPTDPETGVWEYTSADCVEGFVVITETNNVTQETRETVTTTACSAE